MAHIVITSLITHFNDLPPRPPHGWRYLDMTIDGTPITVGVPPEVPTEKQAIKEYLISKAPEIHEKVDWIAAHLPTINHDLDMEFDYPL